MNAVMAKQENKGEIQLAVPGLGERLKAARMACNLDLAKLAARIHLTSDVVDALERDDYSDMPARVFVRGYVRNYARTVNLPAESILAQFDRQWPEEDYHVQLDESPRLAADPHPRRRWPGVMTWLVVLVIVGLTLVWWQGYLDDYLQRWERDTTTPPPAASQPAAPAETDTPTMAPVPATDTGGALMLPLPPAPAATEEPAEPVGETASLSVASQPESMPLVDTAAETATAEERPPETASGNPQVVGTAPEVVVRFLEDSWVDIRDSRREYKLIGIMKQGTERRLGGTPPYTVVLGKAQAVELQVNGRRYDLTPHIQNNVARFTLDP